MKTSLKQLGHFSDMWYGKGFWGMRVHTSSQEEWEVITRLSFSFHQVTSQPLNETSHTAREPTTTLMGCEHSQSDTRSTLFYLPFQNKIICQMSMFLTNTVQI